MRRWHAGVAIGCALGCLALSRGANAQEGGVYGRTDGDLTLSLEAGVSGAFGGWGQDAPTSSLALAARGGVFYLQTVGVFAQYHDGLGRGSQPLARSIAGGVEVRPLFLGRLVRDMQQGPAQLDLLADSFGIGMAVYRSYGSDRFCSDDPAAAGMAPTPACADIGMELSAGIELSLLPQANAPFLSLRGAVRWSLVDDDPAFEALGPTGFVTLSLGYHHLFQTHLVDAGDRRVD